MKVGWTPLAIESYKNIIDQLLVDWNISIIEQFESQVEHLINRIENNNHICPKSDIENLHKCVINKHNSLIYRITNTKSIEVILFIFNKSEHIF